MDLFTFIIAIFAMVAPALTSIADGSHGALGGVCPGGHGDIRELARRLSNGSEIYFPGSARFDSITERWSNLELPNITVAVVPVNEQDVATTVRYLALPRKGKKDLRVFFDDERELTLAREKIGEIRQ